jgi:TatD DNase family protein
MNLPKPTDYIDIHNHGARSVDGQFSIENLMAHEERLPDNEPGLAFSIGIHPWFLTEENHEHLIDIVRKNKNHPDLIALGEAGFDRIKGPSVTLQRITFEEQIQIANEKSKPVFIHCVRAWDELLSEHRKLKPATPWLIHGFRGRKELALQLISKGMYLSFWFDFVLRPESSNLLRELPKEKVFLETDGSGIDIETIYEKVAVDLTISVEELKAVIFSNFNKLFKLK